MSRSFWDPATAVLFLLVGAHAVNWLAGGTHGDSGTFRHTAVVLQAALGLGGALGLWRSGQSREG